MAPKSKPLRSRAATASPPTGGGSGELGGIANTLNSIASSIGAQEIRHFELALGVGIPAYVLGEVHTGGGKSAKGSADKTFVVSYKSEEERAKDLGSTMTFILWTALALFAGAVGLLIWAYNKGPV